MKAQGKKCFVKWYIPTYHYSPCRGDIIGMFNGINWLEVIVNYDWPSNEYLDDYEDFYLMKYACDVKRV